MILAQLSHLAAHQAALGMYLFQESGQTVGFSPMDLWHNMGAAAKAVVAVLFIMSIWSLAVIIDRALYFSAARKHEHDGTAIRDEGKRLVGRIEEEHPLHTSERLSAGT